MSVPCPPPSDASLGSVGSDLGDRLSSGGSAFRPVTRTESEVSMKRGGFRLKGYHVIMLGVMAVCVVGGVVGAMMMLVSSRATYGVSEVVVEGLREAARACHQEKTDLQFVVDSCQGETGDLRSSLTTAVEEQEKLKDAVHTAEFESWSADHVVIFCIILSTFTSWLAWTLKPYPTLPNRLEPNSPCQLFHEKTWQPGKLLTSSTKGVVVQLTETQTVVTAREWHVRAVIIQHDEADTSTTTPHPQREECTSCPMLMNQIRGLQGVEAELVAVRGERKILEVELEAGRRQIEAAEKGTEKIGVYEKELRELRVAEKIASSSYNTTLVALEGVKRQYDGLVNKREDETMLRTEEIVSLATRDLESRLSRETRRRKDAESHTAHLQSLLKSSSLELTHTQDAFLHSEATAAAATCKFLTALNPCNPRRV